MLLSIRYLAAITLFLLTAVATALVAEANSPNRRQNFALGDPNDLRRSKNDMREPQDWRRSGNDVRAPQDWRRTENNVRAPQDWRR